MENLLKFKLEFNMYSTVKNEEESGIHLAFGDQTQSTKLF